MPALQAPAHWAAADGEPFLACKLCDHACGAGATRQCQHPEVAGIGRVVPVHIARKRGGACGPEAHHLNYAGLHA